MPTRWSPRATTRCCSPTGPRRTTLATSGSAERRSWRCSRSVRGRSRRGRSSPPGERWKADGVRMLKLRRGTVTSTDPLSVRVGEHERRAWADEATVGPVQEGDEVIVNVDAADLGLGSGGFDLVHANLSRGLDGDGADGDRVMKLNYTPLQHAIEPV